MEEMNILHIATDYSEGTLVYKNLITELNNHNCCNKVFVPLLKGRQAYRSDICKEIPCFNQMDRVLYFTKQKKLKDALVSEYNPYDFDLICAHTLFSTGYTAYKLNETYGIPYTVSVINTDVNVFFKKMVHLRSVGIKILKNASGIIFISKPYRDYVINNYVPKNLRKEFFDKSYIVPFSIDNFYFENQPQKKKRVVDDGIKLVEVVRDFNRNKNLKTVVKAVEFLNQKERNTTLTLIGNIHSSRDQELIDKYDFIKHIPFSDKEDLIKYLNEEDIFVMASHNETFGLVYAEAISQGLPVIYSRGQGFEGNFAEGEVGYSVESSSYEEIVDRVITICNDYDNMSERCLKNAKRFSSYNVAEEYIKIFKRVLE